MNLHALGWNHRIEILALLLTLGFVFLSTHLQNPLIAVLPIVVLAFLVLIKKTKDFYYLFALVIPFSIEFELPGGFSTDLPSEPIMWILTILSVMMLCWKANKINVSFWKNPISILLFLHIFWLGSLVLTSTESLFSLKFFLAKLWYVVPFYFFFGLLYREQNFIKTFFKLLIGSIIGAVVVIMFRHGLEGFSFRSINNCVHPIFRNHVNYAVMLVALLPYSFWLRSNAKKKLWYNFAISLMLTAIYFSYTRAAMVAILLGLGIFVIVKIRWIKLSMMVALISLSIAIPYFLQDNRFMEYTPNYERTIAHYNFDNLLEATYKLEDISTMERLYRWMAGIEMVQEKPLFGFGPSSFYSNYQKYTITAFETYVSNNPERSGIHNYYLMTMVEQGVVGFLIWISLLIIVFIQGERKYHQLTDPTRKGLILTVLCSIGMVASILAINDLMEVDKIGPLVFIGMAIIAATPEKEVGD
jgi:O-antigen ligase